MSDTQKIFVDTLTRINHKGMIMQEVKVGQVWRHSRTKGEWRVIFVGQYDATIADQEGAFSDSLWKFRDGIYSFVSDAPVELSDLEIVQKALEVSDVYLRLNPSGSANYTTNDYKEIDVYLADKNELLTWAKQTIGEGE